jgi:hypothetical protein
MIVTKDIITKTLKNRNLHILLHGNNIEYIDHVIEKNKFKLTTLYDIEFYMYQDIYYIQSNSKLLELIKEICISPNYYSDTLQKKVIVLINFHELKYIQQQVIKTLIDNSALSCIFIIHVTKLDFVDKNIRSRLQGFSLPTKTKVDKTDTIMYNKIIKLLKGNILNKKVMETIREMSYMYYMNHKYSVNLQKIIIFNISENLSLPNSIKEDVIKDICRINVLYQHSYRKPIFLEFMIISLFKHLENYTYNL